MDIDKDGKLTTDSNLFLREALEELPRLESADAQAYLRDLYDTKFGIFNHIANLRADKFSVRPMAGMAFHPGEDYNRGNLIQDTMDVNVDKKIGDLFKISYLEFMHLTTDYVELMIAKADEITNKEHAAATAADEKLKEAAKELKMNQNMQQQLHRNSRRRKK